MTARPAREHPLWRALFTLLRPDGRPWYELNTDNRGSRSRETAGREAFAQGLPNPSRELDCVRRLHLQFRDMSEDACTRSLAVNGSGRSSAVNNCVEASDANALAGEVRQVEVSSATRADRLKHLVARHCLIRGSLLGL
jgi:hypothetical protein